MASSSIKNNKTFGVTEPQLVEFEFDWEVKKFSTIPPSARVYSPIFEGGFCQWRLKMLPTVYGDDGDDDIMFQMKLIGSAPAHSVANYKLSIRNKGEIINSSRHNFTGPGFIQCKKIGEFLTYFTKMDFEDDILRLNCKVTMYNPQLDKCVTLPGSQVEGSTSDKVLKDLARLFQTMENADISIKVGGNILRAHKAILSIRSPVFARMFAVEMRESAENVVTIDDYDFEVEDVRAMLEYIYTGQTEGVKKNPENLLRLAEKYNLSDLKSACGVQLSQGITIENAIEMLYLADQLKVPNLKSYAEKFIFLNKEELAKTEGFQEFASSELYLKMCANVFFLV